jgi:hypothetical protein
MSNNQSNTITVESTYSQREWDRTVGIGTVPDEYQRKKYTMHDLLRLYDRG